MAKKKPAAKKASAKKASAKKASAKKAAPKKPATAGKATPRAKPAADDTAAVEAQIDGIAPPWDDVVRAVRRIILSVSPSIGEGIKWKSPSFRTTEWFATVNLRARSGEQRVWLILHAGARPGPDLRERLAAADPKGLLEWLGKDRALVTFDDTKDVRAKQAALKAIIKEWIRHV